MDYINEFDNRFYHLTAWQRSFSLDVGGTINVILPSQLITIVILPCQLITIVILPSQLIIDVK